MKQHTIGLGIAFAVALGIAGTVPAQEAVQWRVEDGGNGHWYQFVSGPTCWTDAVALAESRFGHLATFTVYGEQAFLMSRLPNLSQAWIGGLRDPGTDMISGWRWVTGEPWSSAALVWAEDNPGCCFPNEFFLSVWTGLPAGVHDVPACWSVVSGAAIEWSADCNGDGVVDYGQILDGTFEDSNSNGVPDCCDAGESCLPCPSDIDLNGVTDAIDLAVILGRWGTNPKDYPRADANDDGTVDANDLAIVLSGWGSCP